MAAGEGRVIAEVRFVSDAGRPGTCTNTVCLHGEFRHAPDGPCLDCECKRYEPPRFFDDPEEPPRER